MGIEFKIKAIFGLSRKCIAKTFILLIERQEHETLFQKRGKIVWPWFVRPTW